MDTRLVIVVIAIIVAAVVIGGILYMRRRNTRVLRTRFGPEYERSVRERGSAARAEEDLKRRMDRVSKLEIKPLPETARQRYWERWLGVQRTFVDDPKFAVGAADDLIADVMSARGYPIEGFEQRAADISVDHPEVVANYRAAHQIALRNRHGEANTEDLRKAITNYRSLFEELLETGIHKRREVA
jgi:hypothetical protein